MISMKRVLEFRSLSSGLLQIVMIDKIAYIVTNETDRGACIHLINGEVLLSEESVRTLLNRITACLKT